MGDSEEDPLSLVSAARTDFKEVLSLEARSFPECDRMTADELEDFFNRYPGGLYVLRSGEQFAGYVLFTFDSPGEAYLESVAIEPSFRGRGCGRFIVNWAKQHFRNAGFIRLHLHVRQGNSGAVTLYQKEGFKIVGSDPSFYGDGETALLMDNILND